MLSYHLDTSLLAIPNFADNNLDAEAIIERAFNFSTAVSCQLPVRFVISSRAEDCLWSCGCGPQHDVIRDFLELMDLNGYYSANDIVKAYQTLIDRAHRADEVGILEIGKFSSFKMTPPMSRSASPAALLAETERVVATAALGVQNSTINGFVPGWVPAPDGTREVAVVADTFLSGASLAPPLSFTERTDCLSLPRGLLNLSKAWDIWKTAHSSEEIHLAIALEALAIVERAGLQIKLGEIKSFSIGSEFLSSLEENQSGGEQPYSHVTFNVCAQIVADRCSRYNRPMGKESHLERLFDKAKAWRVHLTDSHQALRLMYWKIGEQIEFANVGPKFELEIRDGLPGGGVSCDLSGLCLN